MKRTQNRTAIIKCLSEPNSDCGGHPPYCADSIRHMLEYSHNWYGAKGPVSISQINRTLRDLHAAGLIVKETRIDEPLTGIGLPSRVNYWQMADSTERNELLNRAQDVCQQAEKAHGTLLFNALLDQPMSPEEKEVVIGDLKALMQLTHPDKAIGFEDCFKRLQQSLAYVRSDIDLLKTPHKKLSLT